MPDPTDAPAPAPSAEGRRLIRGLRVTVNALHLPSDMPQVDAADRALSDYVAGLEVEVARLRDLASGAAFHFFCCCPGVHTDEDECDQLVPAMADLAKAISFDADPAANAEIAAVPHSQATERRNAVQRGRAAEGGET